MTLPIVFHKVFQGNNLENIFFGNERMGILKILFSIQPTNEPSFLILFLFSKLDKLKWAKQSHVPHVPRCSGVLDPPDSRTR